MPSSENNGIDESVAKPLETQSFQQTPSHNEHPLPDVFSIVQDQVQKEFGQGIIDILLTGNPQERRRVNQLLFRQAEQSSDEATRQSLHRSHLDLLLQHLGDPHVEYRSKFGKDYRVKESIIEGMLPEGFVLDKGRFFKQVLQLIIDLKNMRGEVDLFIKLYHRYAENPGGQLLEENQVPTELTAAVRATQLTCIRTFGLVNKLTSDENSKKYAAQNSRGLSEFRLEDNMSSAECTEYAALAQQLIAFTGLDTRMITFGSRAVFVKLKDEFKPIEDETGHNFLMLKTVNGDPRIFLYDPVHYTLRMDPQRNVRYPFPFIHEVDAATYEKFMNSQKPISIDQPTRSIEYWTS